MRTVPPFNAFNADERSIVRVKIEETQTVFNLICRERGVAVGLCGYNGIRRWRREHGRRRTDVGFLV